MGILDLLSGITTVAKKHPEARLEGIYLGAFKGSKVAIDISIYAYKFMAVTRKESVNYTNVLKEDLLPEAIRIFWLEKCFDFLMMFIEELVTPILVFDGPPFRLKADTKAERVAKYEEREKKIADLRLEINYIKNKEGNTAQKKIKDLEREVSYHISLSQDDFDALEDMVRAMGIPVIKANVEAEAACARLVRSGLAVATITNDGDALAHLSQIMVIDVKRAYRHGKPMHRRTCIILDNVLSVLELNKFQFIDFCMLLGTDYNKRIKGFGWAFSLKEIKESGCLEEVMKVIGDKAIKKKLDLSEYRLAQIAFIEEIRGYFISDFDINVICNLVVHYEDSLQEFFEYVYSNCYKDMHVISISSNNKSRMLGKCRDAGKVLRDFNQQYACLQHFELNIN